MSYTMITRHGKKENGKETITAYTLISDKYQITTVKIAELAEMLKAKKIEVTNLKYDVEKKTIVSTNGDIKKYTFINDETGFVEGTAKAVILNRAEQNGKLVGYTVFMQNGQIRELNVKDTATLAKQSLISNGKIRPTQEGDTVSAIGGTYPLRVITIDKAPAGTVEAELWMFGASVNKSGAAKYACVMVKSSSAVTLSKLIDKLTDSNAKVKAEVANITGEKTGDSLSIKKGANLLYGAFELDIIKKVLEKANTATSKSNGVIVSVIDYASDNMNEAVVKLSKSGEIKVVSNETPKELKAAQAYAEEIKSEGFTKYIK